MEEPSAVVRAIAFCAQAVIFGVVLAGVAWRTLRAVGSWRTGLEPLLIFAVVASSIYCHLHFGDVFLFDADTATGAQVWRLLTTLIADGALLAIGARIDWAALRDHAPSFLREGLTQWLLGLLIAVVGYVVLTSAQIQADDAIRLLTGISPERLPDAQRELTLALSIYGWTIALCAIGCVAAIVCMRRSLSLLSSHWQWGGRVAAGAAPLALALAYSGPAIALLNRAEPVGRAESAIELAFILDGAFSGNSASPISGPICKNLPPEAHIAFVAHDDPEPTKIFEATYGPKTAPERVISSFRMIPCVRAATQ